MGSGEEEGGKGQGAEGRGGRCAIVTVESRGVLLGVLIGDPYGGDKDERQCAFQDSRDHSCVVYLENLGLIIYE